MSGFCSAHQDHVQGCRQCELKPIRTPVSFQGHEVPWVTRWSNERPDEAERALKPDWDGQRLWIHQLSVLEMGIKEEREANGFLWQKEGILRGGRPEFSQVSTYRQRAAMRKRLCQVCGKKITTPVINWLMADGHIDLGPRGELLTSNPPTCDDCIPIAQELCPHLSESGGGTVVRVLEYELWGVVGESIRLNTHAPGGPLIHDRPHNIPYNADLRPEGFYPTAVLAKQQVIELTKYAPISNKAVGL